MSSSLKNSDDEFTPFFPEQASQAQAQEVIQYEAPIEEPTEGEFELSSNFFESITSDPVLKESIEKEIDRRIQKKIEEDVQALREEVIAKAKKDGFESGYIEGKEEGNKAGKIELDKHQKNLEYIASHLLEAKEEILRSHEAKWCKAFSYLLKRFLIANRGQALSGLEEWIDESLKNYTDKNKIIIKVSSKEYEMYSGTNLIEKHPHWELVPDPALQNRELSVETSDGGVFFSSEEEMKSLEHWIESGYIGSPQNGEIEK